MYVHTLYQLVQFAWGVVVSCVPEMKEPAVGPAARSRNGYVTVHVTIAQSSCLEWNVTHVRMLYYAYIHTNAGGVVDQDCLHGFSALTIISVVQRWNYEYRYMVGP